MDQSKYSDQERQISDQEMQIRNLENDLDLLSNVRDENYQLKIDLDNAKRNQDNLDNIVLSIENDFVSHNQNLKNTLSNYN